MFNFLPHSPSHPTPPPPMYIGGWGVEGCSGQRATRVTHTHTHVIGFTFGRAFTKTVSNALTKRAAMTYIINHF